MNRRFANGHKPQIRLWDVDLLRYYRELYGFIRPYAKFDLLGELDVTSARTDVLEVPALKTTVGNYSVYNFVINPKDLLERSFVVAERRAMKDTISAS